MAYSGTCGTCSWTISDAGLLTINAGKLSYSGGWDDYVDKVKTVNFAGSVNMGTRYGYEMFGDMVNLTSIQNLGRLDTSGAYSFINMFCDCRSLTSLDLSTFNTANVDSMNYMFWGCTSLRSITFGSNFTTTNTTSMDRMFYRCTALTSLNLSTFHTSNVTNMYRMFYDCNSLQSINFGSNFNTAKVTTMEEMFRNCDSLTSLNLSGFSSATLNNLHMAFYGCNNLKTISFGSSFTTAKVTTMSETFAYCTSLTSLNLSSWSSAALTNAYQMFYECEALQTLTFGSNFTMANVTDAYQMFCFCESLTSLNLSYFNTAKVSSFSGFFQQCKALTTITLGSNFKGTAATSCATMFYRCTSLTSVNLTNFNTPNVTSIRSMFFDCTSLTSVTFGSGFSTANVTDMSHMFFDCPKLTSLNLSTFNTANCTDMAYMFFSCDGLTSLNLTSFNTAKVTDMSNMFSSCVKLASVTFGSGFSTANVTTMEEMFRNCNSLSSLDLGRFNTANVTNMDSMFYGCRTLTSLDLSGFNTANVTNMDSMFYDCWTLTSLDLSGFNTANVTNMDSMFCDCRTLTSLDLSGFNTANVTTAAYMFGNCEALTSITFGQSFTCVKATTMKSMFSNCKSLITLNLSTLNTAAATDLSRMFNTCSELTSITFGSNFTAAKAETMDRMFYNCVKLETLDLSMVTPLKVTDIDWMFGNCTSLRSVDLSHFNTPELLTAYSLFRGATSLRTVDLSAMNTAKATNLECLFYGCTVLQSVDVSSFNTANCTDMAYMFWGCHSLAVVDISNFKYNSAISLRSFFANDHNLSEVFLGDLSTTYNVTTMEYMFYDCYHLVEIPGLDTLNTTSVTNLAYMFENCKELTEINLYSANTSNVTTMVEIFLGTTALERITLPDNFVTSALVLPDNVLPDNYFGLCGDETRAIRRVDDGVTITTDADFYQLALTVGGAAGEWLSGKYTSMTLIITRIPDETDETNCDIRVRTMWDLASTDASSAIIKVYKKLARETDYETEASYTVGVSGEYGTTDALIEDLTMDAYDFRVELTATDLTIVAYGSVASDFELINISYDGDVRMRGGVTIGPYAIESSQNAITIGYGGPSNRNNSFEVRWDGTVYMNGGTLASGGLWIQGGSPAGGNVNRMGLTAGMPDKFPYNQSKRGTFIYSNAIAFADPYNGNSNNDAGWIRHIEETANSGTLEIATGDDGNEPIVVRQYNTSSAIVRTATLLDASGNTNFPGTIKQNGTAVSLSGHTHNYAAASHDHSRVTPASSNGTWGSLVTNVKYGISVHWFSATGKINSQPSQYGFLLSMANGDASSECHQIWAEQPNGNLYHRGCNGSTYNTTVAFKTILDSSNYSTYAAKASHTHSYLPLSGGTVTATITLKGANLDRDAANPSSDAWGPSVSWKDTDNELVGFIEPVRRTNGKIELCFRAIHENTSGSEVANNFACCIDRAGNATYWVSNTANFRAAIGAAASSDRRLKTDIQPLGDDAVEFIKELEPASYWINGEKQVGLIAQNVKAADRWGTRMAFETVEEIDGLDEWERMPDGSPTWKLDYIRLLPPTIAALKKAMERIDYLESRISELEQMLGE